MPLQRLWAMAACARGAVLGSHCDTLALTLPLAPPQLHWNLWALHLEIWGQSTFAAVWAAGLLFFLANVAVILALVRSHRFVPSFRAGQRVHLPTSWWP